MAYCTISYELHSSTTTTGNSQRAYSHVPALCGRGSGYRSKLWPCVLRIMYAKMEEIKAILCVLQKTNFRHLASSPLALHQYCFTAQDPMASLSILPSRVAIRPLLLKPEASDSDYPGMFVGIHSRLLRKRPPLYGVSITLYNLFGAPSATSFRKLLMGSSQFSGCCSCNAFGSARLVLRSIKRTMRQPKDR